MDKFKNEVSFPRSGMNKGTDPRNLKESEYTYALNTNLSSVDGDFIDLTFEKSNVLSVKFPEGYKVIGKFNRLLNDRTYYFLHNPITKYNLFGYVDNSFIFEDVQDLITENGSELPEPLENIDQQPYKTFTVLIDDSCNSGFNFDLAFPIKNPVVKEQKTGGVVYFTDNLNPPRFIELDNIETYFIQEEACDDDTIVSCPIFDKMLIHAQYVYPEIKSIVVSNGGTLAKGTYSFIVALTDSVGNEISEYFSQTQPIDIWDEGEDLATNKAIRLAIENLDVNFTHYKLIAVFTEKDNRTTTLYEVGIFSTNQKEVTIANLSLAQRTSFEKISFVNTKVLTAEGLTSANGSLMEYGLKFQEEINLQPVVNLLGSYVQWQTHIAKEDLYSKGDLRAKYTGYQRNETEPLGIRFIMKGGHTTAVMPLVGREAKSFERQEVSPTDMNRKSIELGDTCGDSLRNERWQYVNTATVTETISGDSEVLVETEVFKTCIVPEVATIASGSIDLGENDGYESLEDYIEANIEDCGGVLNSLGICAIYENPYTSEGCQIDSDENCSIGERVSQEVFLSEVGVNRIVHNYDENFNSYSTTPLTTQIYNPYIYTNETFSLNTEVSGVTLYDRKTNPYNNNTKVLAMGVDQTLGKIFQSNFKIIDCADRDDLSTTNYTSPLNFDNGKFTNKVTDLSQWFSVDTSTTGVFVTITKTLINNSDVEFPSESFTFSSTQRVSFFTNSNTEAFHSVLINSNQDTGIMIFATATGLTVKTATNTFTYVTEDTSKVFFVVEQPTTTLTGDKCIKHATRGGYEVNQTPLAFTGRKLEFSNVKFGLKITYKSTCLTNEPVVGDCDAIPYQKGEFGYVESTILYPDNEELYDSTKLVITEEDIPSQYLEDFKTKFTNGVNEDGTLKIKSSFNLACKPIRHFKFPDNNVAPFMTSKVINGLAESFIFPLGITIDENVINFLLDVAVKNGLLSETDRRSIYSYEIFRGDLSTQRSVVASGLLYDFREYEENNKKILYTNYPYNSFGRDHLNQVDAHADLGKRGHTFTFHSPETDYSRNIIGSEIKIEGYQFGQSSGHFADVEDHPKWVILTKKADDLASHLATLEVLFDIAQNQAEIWSRWNMFAMVGVSSGASTPMAQTAASVTMLVVTSVNGILFKYAEYKQRWITTFENLGVSHNFASYYYSVGHYNYLLPLTSDENSVRGLQAIKNIKDGRINITNRITREKYDINHIDREWATFMAIGKDTPIVYPTEYSTYDTDSITYASKEGINKSGTSPEINKKIASAYVHLMNYSPSQHGQINAVNWITTSYKGDLQNPSSEVLPIFGGDTFITRHTLKRKLPLFLTTAMGQSMTTAFDYKSYNNIGQNPAFYVNYKIEAEYSRGGKSLPIIKSAHNLDTSTGKKFYYIAPSKFYLSYYGVPSFLTETRINTHYREYGRTIDQNFYPNVGDVGRWTQENTVKLREPNYFKYAFTYSTQIPSINVRKLSDRYQRKLQSITERATNGVIFSLPDFDENGQTDSWLKFKPLDFYEFDTKFGKLVELKGIENEAILARFEHTAIIYNKVGSTVDDGQTPSTYLGGKSMFQRRTTSFVNSELGYGGSTHNESLSCEYGHFYADNDRGQLIQIPSGGGNMVEISSMNSQGKPTNMREWFKRQLPYKLVNSNIQGIENLSKDNAYNYIGTTFGYDARHKRILITKKDYLPVAECNLYYDQNIGFFTDNCEATTTSCPEGFEFDASANVCRKVTTTPLCPEGYTYDATRGMCIPDGEFIQPEYDGADIVFVIHRGSDISDTDATNFTRIKNTIHDVLKSDIFGAKFGDDNRYAIIKTNYKVANENKKFIVATPFTDRVEASEIVEYLPYDYAGTVTDRYTTAGFYSPTDLAVYSALTNSPEITAHDNATVASSQSIGEFREGNYAKIIYVIGETNRGVGFQTTSSTHANIYMENYLQGTQSGAEMATTIHNLGIEKDVDIFAIDTLGVNSIPVPPNYETNVFSYSHKWFLQTIASTECSHFFFDFQALTLRNTFLQTLDFVGKRECIPQPIPVDCDCNIVGSNCYCEEVVTPTINIPTYPVSLNDTNYFKEVSWTLAYYPEFGQFGSFYSYTPNYYVNHHLTFETGRNDLETLWSHNNTNKSFGVFYGEKNPMEVELVAKSQLGSYLGSVALLTETKRYFDSEDFYLENDITFNKAIIYNRKECSGELLLDVVKGHTRYLSQYPISVSEMSQRIPMTHTENMFNFNYFYNRVIKGNNKPFIKNDENELKLTLDNISFNQRKQLERLNGDYFLNRLTFDKDSRYALTLKLQKSLTNLDNM